MTGIGTSATSLGEPGMSASRAETVVWQTSAEVRVRPKAVIARISIRLSAAMELSAGPSASIRFEPRELDNLAPFLRFGDHKPGEFRRRGCKWLIPCAGNLCLRFGVGQSSIDLLVEFVD